MAGALSGGQEWQSAEADLRGAPVRLRFDRDDRPARVSFRLPPGWKATSEEGLEGELRARLSPWGYWLATVDHAGRRVVADSVEPLPKMLPYNGETASDRGEVVIGLARLSRPAAATKGRQYGDVIPFVWDARAAPHGLIVGTTGAGKSSTFRVIITSWCRNARMRVILLDPKTTEFTLFEGRQGVMTVADTVGTMTETLRQVEAERVRRAALCKRYGVTAVWMLPPGLQPAPWLVVIDEIMDYLDKNAAQTERAKAENELRAEAQDLINRIDQLARVGDIHLLLAGQRLDRKVVDGRIQNNSPLRVLTGVGEAGTTERHMIGLQDVEPEIVTDGRGVAKSVKFPESEVQFTFLDEADLDGFLPMDDAAEREWAALMRASDATESDEAEADQSADKSAGKPAKKRPSADRDSERSSRTDSDRSSGPGDDVESQREREPDDDDGDSQGDEGPPPDVMSWFEE